MTTPGDAGLTERVGAALQDMLWVVQPDAEYPGALHLSPSDGDAPWAVVVRVRSDPAQIAVFSLRPTDVPAPRRSEVALLLTHANDGLVVGNFELDLADGEVRFRTSVDLGRHPVDDDVLRSLLTPLVALNLTTMDLWYDLLDRVVAGESAAEVMG